MQSREGKRCSIEQGANTERSEMILSPQRAVGKGKIKKAVKMDSSVVSQGGMLPEGKA